VNVGVHARLLGSHATQAAADAAASASTNHHERTRDAA
jgi:hypothetical protein